MEVHQHTHTPRKKWTHYFWEFLMLFLAVTLGFFVENQREHIIENKREKKLMRSLLEDLKLDRNKLEKSRVNFTKTFRWLDSAFVLLSASDLRGKELLLAEAVFKGTYWPYITFTEITLSQLRNAGYFRLINNDALANAIASYDTRLKSLNENQLLITENSQLLDEELVTFFDHNLIGRVFQQQMANNISDSLDINQFKNIKLVNYNASVIYSYKIKLKKIWVDYKILEGEYKRNFIQVINLINSLKKEYHMK